MKRATHSTAWRAAFALSLAAGMAASTIVQFLFGVLAPFLIDEFGISRSQLGLLTTAAFVIGGIISPSAGGLVDRIGGRRVFVASMVLMAIAIAGMAAAPSYIWMLFGAALAGFTLASCNPTTNKLIAAHTAVGERGVIMGVKQAGVQFGAFAVGFTIPTAAESWGWRPAMAMTIVLPLACAAAVLVLVPHDRREELDLRPKTEARGITPLVAWLATYAFLMGGGVAIVGAYLPLFAREEVGLSVGAAGMLAGVIGLIGIVSRIAWGWGTERLGDYPLALGILGVGAVVASLATLLSPSTGAWMIWSAAVLFGLTAITWNAIGMLAIVAEVGTHAAGRASGLVQSGFYGGFVVTPALFGYSVDRTDEWSWGWWGVVAMFAGASVVAFSWLASRRSAARRAEIIETV
ncbi:MAG TPA: MFS transporter [Actinomycetota bacterium]|nr:MFS transporter [Actinomycetota bacterium]